MTNEIKPYIFVIEDRNDLRNMNSKIFRQIYECNVVEASNTTEALRTFLTSPKIDLIFTDIDLKDDGKKDKSGVALARIFKELNPEIPIIANSAIFNDNELTKEEKGFFTTWYPKGGMSDSEIDKMFEDVAKQAKGFKEKRFNDVVDKLSILKEQNKIKSDYNEVIDVAYNCDILPSLQIKEATDENDYLLIMLKTNELPNPILVWQRSEEKYTELEIYGYPELYSFGDTQIEAISNLALIMNDFYEDMKKEDMSHYQGPALRIRKFLFNVFNHN